MKPRVLFVPIHVASMVEMFPVAERVAEEGGFEPLFFVFFALNRQQYDLLAKRDLRAIGPGLPTQILDVPKGTESPSIEKPRSLRKQVSHWVERTTPTAAIWHWIEYLRMKKRAGEILQNEKVALLAVLGDRHVGWETAFLQEAHQRQIPSLITPYSLTAPEIAIAYRRTLEDFHSYEVNTPFRRYLQRKYPAWVHRDGDDMLFFLPPGKALAAQACGMMPAKPWILGGGSATRMAVESGRVQKMLLAQGVPAEKMIVTGRASVDQIHATVDNADPTEIRTEMGIPPEERILLCAVPHLGEHGMLPWDVHWAETRFLLETLAEQEATVVLSLHPKSDPAAYQPLAEEFGALIAQRRAYELIPVSDVFVATFSGTVMAAIGCGVPTIIVDFYGLDYTYFDHEPGIVVVKEHAKLAPTLAQIFSDQSYYSQLSEAQKARGSEWIFLDGQCTQRVVDEIHQLVDRSTDGIRL